MCDNCVDGGFPANNPYNHDLSKIQSYHSKEEHFPVDCMVSIGSGLYPLQKLGSVDFHVLLRLKFSGMFQTACPVVADTGSAATEHIPLHIFNHKVLTFIASYLADSKHVEGL